MTKEEINNELSQIAKQVGKLNLAIMLLEESIGSSIIIESTNLMGVADVHIKANIVGKGAIAGTQELKDTLAKIITSGEADPIKFKKVEPESVEPKPEQPKPTDVVDGLFKELKLKTQEEK